MKANIAATMSDLEPPQRLDVLLTIKELARYLNVNERTVLRLAGDKELPAVRIGNQWRFRKEIIDTWLDDQMLGVSPSRLGPRAPVEDTAHTFKFEDCFRPDHVVELPDATNELGMIAQMAGRAEQLGLIHDKVWFIGALVLRETVLASAKGGGVAFPHTIQRHPEQVKRPFMLLGRSQKGIAFYAPDGAPVHLFLMLGLRYEELHLPWLAKVSQLLSDPEVFKRILASRDPSALYEGLLGAVGRMVQQH